LFRTQSFYSFKFTYLHHQIHSCYPNIPTASHYHYHRLKFIFKSNHQGLINHLYYSMDLNCFTRLTDVGIVLFDAYLQSYVIEFVGLFTALYFVTKECDFLLLFIMYLDSILILLFLVYPIVFFLWLPLIPSFVSL